MGRQLYLGTFGSTSVDQASIPPERFATDAKPWPSRYPAMRAERMPPWQYTTIRRSFGSSATRVGTSPIGM